MSKHRPKLLYDTFNARFLTLTEVGNSFISNKDFQRLSKNNHTLIMGPRGSGKTTLLKMLTIPALESWQSKTTNDLSIKEGISFIAVYIPSDIIWKNHLDYIEDILKSVNPEIKDASIKFIFNSNLFISFIQTLVDLINYKYPAENKSKQELLCKKLIKVLCLDEDVPTLLPWIKFELENKLSEFVAWLEEIPFGGELKFINQIKASNHFQIDYLAALTPITTAFEIIYNNSNELKWALCFDELELVPEKIFNKIITDLRAFPQKFIAKLSTSPILNYPIDLDNLQPSYRDDFDIIRIWPSSAEEYNESREFFEELTKNRVKLSLKLQYGITDKIDIRKIFGRFEYYKALKFHQSLYANKQFKDLVKEKKYDPNSLEWVAMRELAYSDDSFSNVLKAKGINPENPILKDQKTKDEFARKVIEIVFNRLIFTKRGKQNKIEFRTRKKSKLYHGWETIQHVTDNNPRYLIGIIDDLIKCIQIKNHIIQPITTEKQSEIIEDVSKRLFYKVSVIPYPKISITSDNKEKVISIADLIEIIGNYFSNNINIEKFSIDPYSCFEVDQKSNQNVELKKLIKLGVDLGVIILLDKQFNTDINSFHRKRFRLTHLLDPIFKLPIRQYKSIGLNSILNSDNFNAKLEDPTKDIVQQQLKLKLK